MNKCIRVVIAIVCCVVVASTWVVLMRSKTTAEKQLDLIRRANTLINDGIYILAVPLLEEAAGYNAAHTKVAEEELKKVYLVLIEKRGYPRKYINLLEKQMNRKDASPEVFTEAALYQISQNAKKNALEILRAGIERTADEGLVLLYESQRYDYEISRSAFHEISAIYNQTAAVRRDDKWGVSDTSGTLLIPCEYEKVSTYSQKRAIVKKDGIIYVVDQNNNRIALAPAECTDFCNLSSLRTALMTQDGWRRATPDLELGTSVFEDIGMYSGGYAAAKIDGKWGVVNTGSDWLIPAQHDEIILDELGRCYAQGAVFVLSDETVYLYVNGESKTDTYSAARPFSDEGYAAVCKDGKWGFIDANGNVKIDYEYEDALSFEGHLAAVKKDGLWGYVSLRGEIVIDTVFLEAKSFSGGIAPVLTSLGWQFITLVEYKKEGGSIV